MLVDNKIIFPWFILTAFFSNVIFNRGKKKNSRKRLSTVFRESRGSPRMSRKHIIHCRLMYFKRLQRLFSLNSKLGESIIWQKKDLKSLSRMVAILLG